MTWLLGGQPSLAEVVKGEKEAVVIILGNLPFVKASVAFLRNLR